jgi:hypothetical protein
VKVTDCTKKGKRPHEHLVGGLIKVFAQDRSWEVVILDDGTTCDAVVTPSPPRYSPEQVLASIMVEQTRAEIDHRRNRNKAQRKKGT